MWWNSVPPWMQGMGMGSGMGQPMTPGAGMPPYGRAPMNMSPVQMGPPGAVPGGPPPAGQPQQPLNPAQMGMLSAMLSQQTQKPAGITPPMDTRGNPVMPGTEGVAAPGLDPTQLGLLAQALRTGRLIGGGI